MKIYIKKYLKLLSVSLVTAALLFNVSGVRTVSASPNTNKEILVSKTTSNEYDAYKALKSKSIDSLIKEGYTKEEAQAKKNVDYVAEFNKKMINTSKLDNHTLNNMGYTSQQIVIIRNYTGTETQMQALAATLYLSTYVLDHGQSDSYSYATLRTDFTWTTMPIFIANDILAASWSEGMYLQVNSGQTYSRLNYGTAVVYGNATMNLNTGGYIKFPMFSGGAWCDSGSFGYNISRAARVPELATAASYGHTQMAVNPTVTFSVSGGGLAAGIGFSFGCYTQATTSNYIPYM